MFLKKEFVLSLLIVGSIVTMIWQLKPKSDHRGNAISDTSEISDVSIKKSPKRIPQASGENIQGSHETPYLSNNSQQDSTQDMLQKQLIFSQDWQVFKENIDNYLKQHDPDGYNNLIAIRNKNRIKRNKLGLYSKNETAYKDYAQYDTDTLSKLVGTGDLLAIAVLSDRYADEGNYDMHDLVQVHGIINGSVSSTSYASVQDAHKFMGKELNSETKPYFFKSMAWRLVGMMFGDTDTSLTLFIGVKEKSNITIDEWKKIRIQADKLYTDINNERITQGLAPFNNPDKYKTINEFEANLIKRGYIIS